MPTRAERGLEARISAFWAWWATNRHGVRLAIEDGTSDRLIATLTREVRSIDARLAWELVPGEVSRHALVLTGQGDPDQAWVAAQAVRAAPGADDNWTYYSTRPPQPLGIVSIAGHDVDLRAFGVAMDRDDAAECIRLTIWSTELAGLPATVRQQAARLFVDNVLGESESARWISDIEVSRVDSGLAGRDLLAAVTRLRDEATGVQWALVSHTDSDGRAVLVYVNAALKRFDHLDSRWHLVVDVDERPDLDDPSVSPVVIDPVAELEAVGGTLVAVTKDRFRRRFHVVHPAGRAVPQAARLWAACVRPRALVEQDFDPQWQFLERLTRDPRVVSARHSTVGSH